MSHLYFLTTQSENGVWKIIYLQQIVNQFPDAFIDACKLSKSYAPATNILDQVIVHTQHSDRKAVDELSIARLKHGKPLLKDSIP